MEAKQRLTKRQIQANNTRNRVHKVALELMEKKGLNNTSIDEISKKAGVSVGTFYNYFKSKDDVLADIFSKADDYFRDVVEEKLKEQTDPYQQIMIFFKYYAKYSSSKGLDNASQLYNTKNKLFLEKDRFMPRLLISTISEGQQANQVTKEMTADEIADFCMIAARGVVFNWCLHDGEFELEHKMESYMKQLLQVFIIDENDSKQS